MNSSLSVLNCLLYSAPSSLFQKVAFWRPLTVKWSPSPDFRQNFGRQKFFPLAMATKMVTAWSGVRELCALYYGVVCKNMSVL